QPSSDSDRRQQFQRTIPPTAWSGCRLQSFVVCDRRSRPTRSLLGARLPPTRLGIRARGKLHLASPFQSVGARADLSLCATSCPAPGGFRAGVERPYFGAFRRRRDRKSTRLNSSHVKISYAVFCLKKKTTTTASRLLGLLGVN